MRLGRLRYCSLAAFISLTQPCAAMAQGVSLTGRISTPEGRPLAGASVGIPSLRIETRSGVEGRYTLTLNAAEVRGDSMVVVARFIGYKPQRAKIRLDQDRIERDFILERDVLNLEDIVVTGTSDAVAQKLTPFSITAVDRAMINEVPAASPLGALAGKVAGAAFVTPSGEPGSAPAIRLRSATTLVGSSQPLMIVDGTITRLTLADINTQDIDRIEIIKGAAATSLYGSDAANGVVQIFTGRNAALADNQTTLTVRTELGKNTLARLPRANMHHHYQVLCGSAQCAPGEASTTNVTGFLTDSTGKRIEEDDFIADNRYPAYNNPLRAMFRTGHFLTTYMSYGQRRGNSNFSASFQDHRDEGIIALKDGYSRRNLRINADQALKEYLDVGVGAFYSRSTADQAENYDRALGTAFGLAQEMEPDLKLDSIALDCPPANPTCSWKGGLTPIFAGRGANPLYRLQQQRLTNDRERFTGTFNARYRPTDWLRGDANIGYDAASDAYQSYSPVGFIGKANEDLINQGRIARREGEDRHYNANVSLTSSLRFGDQMRNTSKVALVHEDQKNSMLGVTAARLSVPHIQTLAAADPTSLRTTARTETVRATNAYFVTTFDFDERYILDGLVRQDRSSVFGASERAHTYHRFSGAWRVTEDFRIPFVDEVKLRVSQGTAGLRPTFAAQYEVLAVVGGLPEKVTAGNPNLRPAYSREKEYGFNASILSNYSAEYSFSQKRTTDQIMLVPISSTTGYKDQWQNVGTLEGNTHEIALAAVLLAKSDYLWRLSVTGERTRQRVTYLARPPFIAGRGFIRVQEGDAYGVMYGRKLIRTEAGLEETIRTGRLPGSVTDYMLNEDGYYVAKSRHRTVDEVPLMFWACGAGDTTCSFGRSTNFVRLGDLNPDFTMGFNTIAQWKCLSLAATLTWMKGGLVQNYTRQSAFFSGGIRDPIIDESDKPAPGPCPALEEDPNCPYTTGRKPVSYYQALAIADEPFLEKTTYLKLRELAVNWAVPERMLASIPMLAFRTAKLGIVGRNLWTKSQYSGYDPDVAVGSNGHPFLERQDYFSYPPYRSFTVMLELGL